MQCGKKMIMKHELPPIQTKEPSEALRFTPLGRIYVVFLERADRLGALDLWYFPSRERTRKGSSFTGQ